ncbi:hypothetical protein ACHAP5_009383 [Fusarium lateritium]
MSASNSDPSGVTYGPSGAACPAANNLNPLPNPPTSVDHLNPPGHNGFTTYPSFIGNYGRAAASLFTGSAGHYGFYTPTPSLPVNGYHALPDGASLPVNESHNPIDNGPSSTVDESPNTPDGAHLPADGSHGPIDNDPSFAGGESPDAPDGTYPPADESHGLTDNGPSSAVDESPDAADGTHPPANESHGLTDNGPSFAGDESLDDSDSEPSPLPQPPTSTSVDESKFGCPEILQSVLDNRDGKFTVDRQLVIGRVLICLRENPENPFPEYLLYAPDHNDKMDRDRYLLIARYFQLRFAQIKELGEFPISESTLRGRYRQYTTEAEHRPRKPEWTEAQTQAMLMATHHILAQNAEIMEAKRAGRYKGPCPPFRWTDVGKLMRKWGVKHHFSATAIARQFRASQ